MIHILKTLSVLSLGGPAAVPPSPLIRLFRPLIRWGAAAAGVHDMAIHVNRIERGGASISDTQIDIWIDTWIDKRIDNRIDKASRHTDRHTDRHRDRYTDRHTDRHRDRHTDRHMDRHMDRHTDSYTDSKGVGRHTISNFPIFSNWKQILSQI